MGFAFSGCLIKAGSLNVLFLLFLKCVCFGKGLAKIVFQAAYGAEIGSLKPLQNPTPTPPRIEFTTNPTIPTS